MNDRNDTRSSAGETAIRLHELTNQIKTAKSAPLLQKAAAAERALDTALLVLWTLHDRLRAIEAERSQG